MDGCDVSAFVLGVENLQSVFQEVAAADEEELFIIGGATLYKAAIDDARQLYITEIHHDFPDADTFFPAIDPAVWEEVEREDFPADDRHAYPYSFVTYRRR